VWLTAAMRGTGGVDCPFCDLDGFRESDLFIEADHCIFASNGFEAPEVLPGSGIVVPKAHRESPFELTGDEWSDTHSLLRAAKAIIDERFRPDGYNLIWNVGSDGGQEVAHVHLHVIPRFHDEPLAGRGARSHLKAQANRRPDPSAPGLGRA
jgi:histidine triad (HIT) family protein